MFISMMNNQISMSTKVQNNMPFGCYRSPDLYIQPSHYMKENIRVGKNPMNINTDEGSANCHM